MKIQLMTLSEGEHIFTAQLPPAELSFNPENFSQAVNTTIRVDKRGDNFYIKIKADTSGSFNCDRCLADIDKKLYGELTIIYTEDEHLWGEGADEDIRLVPKDGNKIDLTGDIRDAILLTIPTKQLCSEECKGLCPRCGINFNEESCSCKSEEVDPRWEALKKLKT